MGSNIKHNTDLSLVACPLSNVSVFQGNKNIKKQVGWMRKWVLILSLWNF